MKGLGFYPTWNLTSYPTKLRGCWQKTQNSWSETKDSLLLIVSGISSLVLVPWGPVPTRQCNEGQVTLHTQWVVLKERNHEIKKVQSFKEAISKAAQPWPWRETRLVSKQICLLLQRETLALCSSAICCTNILRKITGNGNEHSQWLCSQDGQKLESPLDNWFPRPCSPTFSVCPVILLIDSGILSIAMAFLGPSMCCYNVKSQEIFRRLMYFVLYTGILDTGNAPSFLRKDEVWSRVSKPVWTRVWNLRQMREDSGMNHIIMS